MSIHRILRLGDPELHRVSAPVRIFDTDELRRLIDDLWNTMAVRSGAGLAAPQIGEFLRVLVFSVDANPRYPEAEPIPPTVLINPVITPLEETLEPGWEGCLSIPGMRGLVPRFAAVRYRGFDAAGEIVQREVSGFHARVVQHECDHLDGILYPQRMTDLSQFGFEDELTLAERC